LQVVIIYATRAFVGLAGRLPLGMPVDNGYIT